MTRPLALQLYSLREQAKDDFPGVLRQVADAGYAGVEFAGLHGHDAKEVRKVLDDCGLEACSAHGAMPEAADVAEAVQTAQTLGYDTLISMVGKETFASADAIREAGEALQRTAASLKGHGLRLGYHNHWWEMAEVDGRHGVEHLLRAAPDLGLQCDIYWASNFGEVDVPAFIAKHAERLVSLHVKDGPLVEGEPQTPVGSGKMDIPACVAAAGEKGDWLIVELDDCAGDMLQAVRDSAAYLTGEGLARGRE